MKEIHFPINTNNQKERRYRAKIQQSIVLCQLRHDLLFA